MYEIEWTELSIKDYNELDGSQKEAIDKAINRIKLQDMQAGEQLHGNLHNCRKLKQKKLGLQIIFRETAGKIEVIQIVAIGRRDKSTIYKTAEKRL